MLRLTWRHCRHIHRQPPQFADGEASAIKTCKLVTLSDQHASQNAEACCPLLRTCSLSPRVKMHDRLRGLRRDHLGNEAAMTRHRVLLEAQQACTPSPAPAASPAPVPPARGPSACARGRSAPSARDGRRAPHRARASACPVPADARRRCPAHPARRQAGAWRSPACATAARRARRSAARPARRAQLRQHVGDGAALVADGQQIAASLSSRRPTGSHAARRQRGPSPAGSATVACFFADQQVRRAADPGNV